MYYIYMSYVARKLFKGGNVQSESRAEGMEHLQFTPLQYTAVETGECRAGESLFKVPKRWKVL